MLFRPRPWLFSILFYTLTLDAVGPDRKPMTGRVDLVKEHGAWKLFEAEQWTPKA